MVGVLGGMGPAATAHFLHTLTKLTAAKRDQDHISTLTASDADIPDRTAFIVHASNASPVPKLITNAQTLERAGCSLIAIPCNTAHAFYEDVAQSVSIPILNMIEITLKECLRRNATTIGILATQGTLKSGLYQQAAKSKGIGFVAPSIHLQKTTSDLIYEQIKAGREPHPDELMFLIDEMLEENCDLVILGCTELSVLFAQRTKTASDPYTVDPLVELAKATISSAGGLLRADSKAADSQRGGD